MAFVRVNLNRRGWLVCLSTLITGLLVLRSEPTIAQPSPSPSPSPSPGTGLVVLKVVAQKFKYTPSQIFIKKGQRTVLEFTTLDFVHGFSIPDLKIRSDLMPGRVTRVELRIEREGVYDFLCDNFCGSEHEEMTGQIVVSS